MNSLSWTSSAPGWPSIARRSILPGHGRLPARDRPGVPAPRRMADSRNSLQAICDLPPRATPSTPLHWLGLQTASSLLSRLPRARLITVARSPGSDCWVRSPTSSGRVTRTGSQSTCRKSRHAISRMYLRSTRWLKTLRPSRQGRCSLEAGARKPAEIRTLPGSRMGDSALCGNTDYRRKPRDLQTMKLLNRAATIEYQV